MKSISKAKQHLSDLEFIINSLKHQLDITRNICYRYYLKHGVEIQVGKVVVPDSIDIDFHEINGKIALNIIDCGQVGMKGAYEKIIEKINNL